MKFPSSLKKITNWLRKKTQKNHMYKCLLQLPIWEQFSKSKKCSQTYRQKKLKTLKIINGKDKPKQRINMTAKDPSRKQIIVPISNENKAKFIKESSVHITNLNRALTNIKSEVMADFVHSDQAYITTITNKVAFSLDLQMIEKYVKNVNSININKFNISWLPQSKSYLKIIGIPYLLENTNTSMSADIVESIIKSNIS